MSLDIWLHIDKCPLCGRHDPDDENLNYTHNVVPMWQEAGCYESLYNSAGDLAQTHIDTLQAAVDDMTRNPQKYINMNPENGWGAYDTALPWLVKVLKLFRQYPGAEIGIWK